MAEYTIAETFTLPSKGLVYKENNINPVVKLRSMTVEEEMKRLAYSELPYKMLAEIIDDCLVEKPGISVYDMCIGDYEFLLHKLREVTYGSDYKINSVCPQCEEINKSTIDLSKLNILEYSADESEDKLSITLPQSKKHIKLKLQTPRMLDEIKIKSEDLKKKFPDMKGEPAFLLSIIAMIESVDNEVKDEMHLNSFVKKLGMRDVNYLIQKLEKVQIGVDTNIECTCQHCGKKYNFPFPVSSEFFRPTIE